MSDLEPSTPSTRKLRPRPGRTATPSVQPSPSANGDMPNSTPSSSVPLDSPSTASPSATSATRLSRPLNRNSPYLPTPLEAIVLATYPTLLIFGALFALIDPTIRTAPYDAAARTYVPAHLQETGAATPSYFARKDNLFNVFFVKRGWGWVSLVFALFLATHPAMKSTRAKVQAVIRWTILTGWWILVTQWFFGPALIDRGFRWTGGKCEVVQERVETEGFKDAGDVFSAAACRSVGGRWAGGHDISGHVFLLVLGSFFLVQEVGWVVLRYGSLRIGGVSGRRGEERSIVMGDGAVKGAGVEAEEVTDGTAKAQSLWDALGLGGKAAAVVAGMSSWMILMTAIYFHTWIEKVSTITNLISGFGNAIANHVYSLLVCSLRRRVSTSCTSYRGSSRHCAV
jgi:hypothetical protein